MYVVLYFFSFAQTCIVQNVKNDIFLKALGDRIRALRKERKLTQEDLGAICNNHGEQIGRIERGQVNVTSSTLYMIAKGLKIPLKELFDF
ncbi:MAG: transcriptional regulator [Bacteroidetes bacterium]|nr:MAG: transcriptional regulator [Bacteroidota bacterium]